MKASYKSRKGFFCSKIPNALFDKENRKPLNELKSYNFSEIKHGACENKAKCQICEEIDQIVTITSKGKQIINYFSCEKFVKTSPKERFSELNKKNLCFQCLTPGLKFKHPGYCFDKYKCTHDFKLGDTC